jgi:glycosyltransferase involved in cell wall biosynthesis
MKKTIVISSLAGGGAEKVLVRLTDEWVKRGDDVLVITTRSPGGDMYRLPDGVTRISMRADSLRWYSFLRYGRLLLRLRREIQRTSPDVAISFTIKTNILTLLATVGLRVPVVACERSVIGRSDIARRNGVLRRLAYRRAACITVLTEAAKKSLRSIVPGVRIESIPNPLLVQPAASRQVSLDLGRYFPGTDRAGLRFLVGMGRLHPVKGFDLLLEAFSQIRETHPEWRLLIFGEGDERPRLEAFVRERGMQGVVSLPGFLKDSQAALASADLFAVPSRFEGFGNVIIEAMAEGLPVVAFDCPDGPAEIISHPRDGLLVERENPAAMARALQRLMDNEDERRRLARAAEQSARRYDMERILGMWDSVLSGI